MSAEEIAQQMEAEDVVKRESGIGGSEIAAVLGLSPYDSPFDVWLSKTGRAPERVVSAPMRWGTLLQKAIITAYEEDTGVSTVTLFDEPRRHPDRPWQVGSPDAIRPNDKIVVEAKAPGVRQASKYGPAGSDEIPDEHALQVRWYLSLMGYEEGHIAVLLGGQDFRVYTLHRDRELEAAMLSAAYKFWTENVQADVPPEVTDTERTRDWLRRAFPKELAPLRQATEDESLLVAQYRAARKQLKHVEELAGNYDIKIRAAIAEAEGLEGEGFRLTYRKPKDSEKTDWKAAGYEMRDALSLLADAASGIKLVNVTEDFIVGIRRVAESGLAAIPAHTTITPGSRRLLPKFEGED